MRRRFQVDQTFDAQIVVQFSGERPADAGDGTEQQQRIVFTAQAGPGA